MKQNRLDLLPESELHDLSPGSKRYMCKFRDGPMERFEMEQIVPIDKGPMHSVSIIYPPKNIPSSEPRVMLYYELCSWTLRQDRAIYRLKDSRVLPTAS